jgi:hypothetical protein
MSSTTRPLHTIKEKQAVIAGRSRMGPPWPSTEGRGKQGGSIVPSERISRSPIRSSGDIGRWGAQRESPKDAVLVPLSEVDRKMGVEEG